MRGQTNLEPQGEIPPVNERQVRELVASLDALVQRLMLTKPPMTDCDVECTQQDMRAVAVMGRIGPVIMSDLAGMLGVPLSTATHMVDRLVAKGLVERTRKDEDRRIVKVELSEKGLRIHQSFLDFRLAMGRSMLEGLSLGEREIFLELIAKMTRSASSPAKLENLRNSKTEKFVETGTGNLQE